MTIKQVYSRHDGFTIYAIVRNGKLDHFAYETASSYVEGFDTASKAICAAISTLKGLKDD